MFLSNDLLPVYKIGKVFKKSCIWPKSASYNVCPDFSSGACEA